MHGQKVKQKLKDLEKKKSFYGKIKKHFSTYLKGCQLPKFVSDFRLRLQKIKNNVKCPGGNDCVLLRLIMNLLIVIVVVQEIRLINIS